MTVDAAGRVAAAGFYDLTDTQYHADPAPEPSLSSSVAKILLDQSCRHAWLAHPRFNPTHADDERDPTRPMEIGTAAHKLTLGKGAEVFVIDAKDYKTNDAKAKRATAYAAGLSPILRPDLDKAEAIREQVFEQLAGMAGCEGFLQAAPEVVAVAQDQTGAWLRAMMDKFEDQGDRAVIWDIKTGDQPANPNGLGRRIANMSYEVQAAFYERAILSLRPALAGRLTFRWVFVENDAPHLITVAELDNTGLEIGRKKVAAAIGLWNRCLQTGTWPGYPRHIITAEYPQFAENAWLAREDMDEQLAGLGLDPFLSLAPWRPQRAAVTDLSGAC